MQPNLIRTILSSRPMRFTSLPPPHHAILSFQLPCSPAPSLPRHYSPRDIAAQTVELNLLLLQQIWNCFRILLTSARMGLIILQLLDLLQLVGYGQLIDVLKSRSVCWHICFGNRPLCLYFKIVSVFLSGTSF